MSVWLLDRDCLRSFGVTALDGEGPLVVMVRRGVFEMHWPWMQREKGGDEVNCGCIK